MYYAIPGFSAAHHLLLSNDVENGNGDVIILCLFHNVLYTIYGIVDNNYVEIE